MSALEVVIDQYIYLREEYLQRIKVCFDFPHKVNKEEELLPGASDIVNDFILLMDLYRNITVDIVEMVYVFLK